MLLEKENWRLGYHQIVSDCSSNYNSYNSSTGGTVLILANPDADALCAARMLSYALRADKIPYQLRPCGGYRRLIDILRKLNLNPDQCDGNHSLDEDGHYDNGNGGISGGNCTIRAVILLNLGGTKNLQSTLFEPTTIPTSDNPNGDIDEGEESIMTYPPILNPNYTKLYILDSHRPYHLANMYAGKNIVVWNDFDHWHEHDGGIPSDGEGLDNDSDSDSERESDEEEDEESDSEQEAEFDDGMDEGDNNEKDDLDHEDSASVDASIQGSVQGSNQDEGEENEHEPMHNLDHDSDDDNDESSPNAKRSSSTPDASTRKKARSTPSIEQEHDEKSEQALTPAQYQQDRKNRIRQYYSSGSFHSSPVAYMAYTLLADQLRHDTVGDLLWLACIGVTDAFLHGRLDLSGYAQLAVGLQEKIERVYPDLSLRGSGGGGDRDDMDLLGERVNNIVHAEDLYLNDGDQNHANNSNNNTNERTQVGYSENGRIFYQRDEFRFFLLRHNNLWDAMILSPDLNTKMELWRNKGIKRLQEMLAKMGLPLTQCQQPYAFMKPSLKRRLKLMMMEHEEEYGLENLKYTAFIRVSGYKSLLSASDMSLAVTALLECDTSPSKSSSTTAPTSSTPSNPDTSETNEEEEEERSLIASFNVAYDALNSNGSSSSFATIGGSELGGSTEGADLSTMVNGGEINGNTGLGAGVRLAIAVQKAIITTAVGLVERKAITRLSHFRYAYLHATSQGVNGSGHFQGGSSSNNNGGGGDTNGNGKANSNHHIFAKPLALTKLAHYLMDMHRANQKWTGTRALPLILLAEKPQTQSYLVVGFEYPDIKGSTKKNHFGERFEMAARSMEGNFKFDSFDSHVIEVKSGDVGRFVEKLHYMIDSI